MKLSNFIYVLVLFVSCLSGKDKEKSVIELSECSIGTNARLASSISSKVNYKKCPFKVLNVEEVHFQKFGIVYVKKCKNTKILKGRKGYLLGEEGLQYIGKGIESEESIDHILFNKGPFRRYNEATIKLGLKVHQFNQKGKLKSVFPMDLGVHIGRILFLDDKVEFDLSKKLLILNFNIDKARSPKCKMAKGLSFNYMYCREEGTLKIFKNDSEVGYLKIDHLIYPLEKPPFKIEGVWFYPLYLGGDTYILFEKEGKSIISKLETACRFSPSRLFR